MTTTTPLTPEQIAAIRGAPAKSKADLLVRERNDSRNYGYHPDYSWMGAACPSKCRSVRIGRELRGGKLLPLEAVCRSCGRPLGRIP